MDLYRLGAFGPTNWVYTLRVFRLKWHPVWNLVIGVFLSLIFFPFLKWIMLPAIGAALMFAGYERAAEVTIGLWIIFMLYDLTRLEDEEGRERKLARPSVR